MMLGRIRVHIIQANRKHIRICNPFVPPLLTPHFQCCAALPGPPAAHTNWLDSGEWRHLVRSPQSPDQTVLQRVWREEPAETSGEGDT